jgi:hypothetical protein
MNFPACGNVLQGGYIMQPALFVREVRIELEDAHVHLIGMAGSAGDQSTARLPVSHVVMSNEAFRQLLADGRRKLGHGAN